MPNTSTVASLAEELCAAHDLRDAEVVRVQGTLSDETIPTRLSQAGARVLPITVYHTLTPPWPDDFRERLVDYPPDVVLFTSGSTVNGLFELLSPDEIDRWVRGKVLASIGPMTSRVVQARGLAVTVEATQYSVAGLIDALAEYFNQHAERQQQ